MKFSVFSRAARAALLAAGVCAFSVPLRAQESAGGTMPDVFAKAQLFGEMRSIQNQFQSLAAQGQFNAAEKLLNAAIQKYPDVGGFYLQLAVLNARQEKNDEVFKNLAMAVMNDGVSVYQLRMDASFDKLRPDARFLDILDQAEKRFASREPKPDGFSVNPISDGEAVLTESNVILNQQSGVFNALFSLKPSGSAPKEIVKGQGKAGEMIRAWRDQGSAAGLEGVLYDNRDNGLSAMNLDDYPQMIRFKLAPDLEKSLQFLQGRQMAVVCNFSTIGNSSVEMKDGSLWRSMPRLAMVNPALINACLLQYTQNMLYVYPSHKDCEVGRNGIGGYGDVFPANCPYFIISKGGAGSEQPFLNALACSIAALRPETRRAMEFTGTLAPSLQMIMRRTLKGVNSSKEYLSGIAHPAAFSAESLDVEKMARLANSIEPGEIPPVARLRVVEESVGMPGVDYFDFGMRESLFNTPYAIARVVRSVEYTKKMTVSAENSRDFNGRPLIYHWVILRGDPEKINIVPLNKAGTSAQIQVSYHERRAVLPGSDLESNRVDIGVFAHNGVHYSAPAFVTFFYLDSESRTYDTRNLIQSVEYKSPKSGGNYADPFVDMPKDWRDDYRYDAHGRIAGWTRTRGDKTESFTADGLLVLERDEKERALKAEAVRYAPKREDAQTPPVIEQISTGNIFVYEYASDEDMIGRIVGRSSGDEAVDPAPSGAHGDES